MTSRDIGTIHHQLHGPPNVLIIFIIININIWINLCVFWLILQILKLTIIYTSSDHYISNHITRTWNYRRSKFFNPKLLLLNHLLNNYFLLNTSCSKIQSPFFSLFFLITLVALCFWTIQQIVNYSSLKTAIDLYYILLMIKCYF
jgi:hypothetical protein